MTKLGSMRHRVTLMGEDTMQGAGGRILATDPVIADVWATVNDPAGSLEEQGGRQFIGQAVSFEVHYQPGFMAARKVGFGSSVYKVHSVERTMGLTPVIRYQASRLQNSST